ncbi:CdaR family transcriptional regulator [Conexibacter sp. SYSU D00693]|uniref:PucR family transcriptional regulator n=1 Tax=Conexibacter sp. SYSU D00693 TaxID=2812560 RepID=UPI00196ADEAA|nr:helix-turn-helix domain-containing protein [Conexibacter sp. SYSU D00693]
MAAPSWQQTLLVAGAEVGLDALVDLVTEELAAALPGLRDDPDLLDAARASSAANVALLVEVGQRGAPLTDIDPPVAAVAFAQELARRNVPVADLTRAYRVAQHALWRWAVGQVRERLADPGDVARALEELSEATFVTGDLLNTVVMERYAVERERWMRSADAVRRATVEELLAGGAVDAEAASRRLRYELRQTHQAFVVWADDEAAVPETAAAAIGGPRALLVPLGAGLIAGWAPAGTLDLDAAVGAAPVALGTPADGPRGFRRGHHEATEARRVARLLHRGTQAPTRYADVALLALLTKDLDQAREFARRTLGPLAGPDPAVRRLAETLLVVLEEQGSPRRASARLGVHENTVAKRLRAVEELLPTHERDRPAELLAALLVLRVVQDR